MPQYKIDTLGIGQIVKDLTEAAVSRRKMVEIINAKYLPEGEQPINVKTIQRWQVKEGVAKDPAKIRHTNNWQYVNPLTRLKFVANEANRHMKRCDGKLLQADTLQDWAAVSNSYAEAVKSYTSILVQLTKYESDLLKNDTIKGMIRTILSMLDEWPEIKLEFTKKIRDNKDLYELIKQL